MRADLGIGSGNEKAVRAGAPAGAAALLLALLAATLVGALHAPPADARRLFVPHQHPTIQKAVDAAAAGDTIWVAAGTYRGPIMIQKRLLLFGDGGPDSTILDGGDSVRVVHVEGVNGGGIVGFGIRRGKAVAGGGVYCLRDTSFSIDFCTFNKNWESAVASWGCLGLKIADSRFGENLGSAVRWSETKGFILHCEFRGNVGEGGGAIALSNSELSVPLRNCLFHDNRAEQTVGGAIFADSSRLSVANCTFTGNSSSVAGGAIAAVNRSFVAVSRCDLQENHAAQGGALHADLSQLLVGFSIFARNHASAGGAAIGVLGRVDANINQTFSNNTFYKNTTNGTGATIFAVKTSPEIVKNIFVVEGKDQLAVAGLESSPRYECNLIDDPSGSAIGSLPSPDTFVGDPLFCDVENGNFDLRDLSPALRAPCGPIGARPRGCSTFQLQPSR